MTDPWASGRRAGASGGRAPGGSTNRRSTPISWSARAAAASAIWHAPSPRRCSLPARRTIPTARFISRLAGRHPDLHEFERAGPYITVEQADSIIREANRSGVESDRKVLVLVDFHLVQPAVEAKLLKTIEEPPAGTVFVVLAETVSAVARTDRIAMRAHRGGSAVAVGAARRARRRRHRRADRNDGVRRGRRVILPVPDCSRPILGSPSASKRGRRVPHVLDDTGATVARLIGRAALDDRRRGSTARGASRASRSPSSRSESSAMANAARASVSSSTAIGASFGGIARTRSGSDSRRSPAAIATRCRHLRRCSILAPRSRPSRSSTTRTSRWSAIRTRRSCCKRCCFAFLFSASRRRSEVTSTNSSRGRRARGPPTIDVAGPDANDGPMESRCRARPRRRARCGPTAR